MAVGRSLNVKGQMRIDVPHMRLIESGVVYDFDTLAGGILAGKLPYVITGFVPAAWTNGSPASSLSLVTANSIFVNYQASENGSMLMVPADRLPEALTVTNSRVIGSFSVSHTNYVSLDLIKTEDSTTSDVVHFIDPATLQGTPKIIPLGRTMDYRIYISTTPFSGTPQRCPVMKVVTDGSNNIVSVTDARPMMFRLAAGGDTPNILAKYSWPQGRTEAANSFIGGDKAIGDLKSWVSAIEEMIWQINAGEYWYSNTQMTSTWFMPGAVSDWHWDGTTLTWDNPLEIVFTGSTAMHNTIAAGSIALPANSAVYVDFNRYVNGSVLLPHTALISTLGGEPATPGIRYPIVWRVGSGIPAVRNFPVPVGASLVVGTATTTTSGTVRINTADGTPYAVITDGLNGTAIANGLKRPSAGTFNLGATANETTINLGGGVDGQAIVIGRAVATAGTTSIYGKTTNLGMSTASTNIYGNTVYVNSATSTLITGNLTSISSTTLNLNGGAPGTANIGCGLLTGTTNTINIGTTHAGTGASTINIGQELAGTATVLAGTVNINTTGTFGVINVGSGAATGAITIGSATSISVGCMNTLSLQCASAITIGTLNLIGSITIGSNTVKARATAATVGGDNALTLATKGYVDGAISAGVIGNTWAAISGNLNWSSNAYCSYVPTTLGRIVFLRGSFSTTAGGVANVVTLPAGYAPGNDISFQALGYIAGQWYPMNLMIRAGTGQLECYYYSAIAGAPQVPIASTAVYVNGITFLTY